MRATLVQKQVLSHLLGKSDSKKVISQFLCSRMYITSITYMQCTLPNSFPFINAVKKKKVKDCSCSRLIREMFSSRKGARMLQVLKGIWQFSIIMRSQAIMRASLFSSCFSKAEYFPTGMLDISISSSKMSTPHSKSLTIQALRKASTATSRYAVMIPANPLRQCSKNFLRERLRKRRLSQQLMKQTSNWLPSTFERVSFTSILVLVCSDCVAFLKANLDDCAFCMMLCISFSGSCQMRLADSRINIFPASFFMLELTLTSSISCIISSSSFSSSSIIEPLTEGQSGLLYFVSAQISRMMASGPFLSSMCLRNISSALFWLLSGVALAKICPSTDLL